MITLAGPPSPLLDAISSLVRDAWSSEQPADNEAIQHTTGKHVKIQEVMIPNTSSAGTDDKLVIIADDVAESFTRLRIIGFGPVEALRQLTACDAILGSLAVTGVPVLTRESLANPNVILRHLSLTVREPSSPIPVLAQDIAMTDQERVTLNAVMPGGMAFTSLKQRRPILWPITCMFDGDNPNQPAPSSIDLTGPARILVYGPYFHLPPGTWKIRTRLQFATRCEGVWFALELHDQERIGRCRFQGLKPGLYAAEFTTTVARPNEPLELRFILERGAIDGRVALLDIALTPA